MTSSIRRSVGLAAVLVLALASISSPAAAVDATAPAESTTVTTEIDDCTVIDSPGRYVLTTDITASGTCLEIRSSDVVVDGQGHTLEADNASARNFGIHANGTRARLSNVTVRDVELEGWVWDGFGNIGRAVRFERVDNGRITNIEVNSSERAVELENTNLTVVVDNDMTWAGSAGQAIYLRSNSQGNRVVNNTITEPGSQVDYGGIGLSGAVNNTVRDNEIYGSGVRLSSGSDRNLVTGNIMYPDNLALGIRAVFSANNSYTDNRIYGPGQVGIRLDHAGNDNLVAGNEVNGTGRGGIALNRVDNTTVRDNFVYGNDDHAIAVEIGSNITVRNNTVGDRDGDIHNSGWGITVYDVDNSTIGNNTVYISGGSGIRLRATTPSGATADHNDVVNNTVYFLPVERYDLLGTDTEYDGLFRADEILVASGQNGIRLADADGNRLAGNTVRNGWDGIEIVADADNNTLVDNRVYELNNDTRSALRIENATGTTVDSLDIGNSTVANTTVSLSGRNVSINTNGTAVSNPDARAAGRYVEATNVSGNASLTVALHYGYGDVADIDPSTFGLWRFDGEAWHELDRSSLDTDNQTVETTVNGSTLDSSRVYGAFGSEGNWPTPTRTAESTATGSEDGTATTGGSGPGFGVAAAVVALAVGVILRGRRE